MALYSVNPYTEKVIGKFQEHTMREISDAVDDAHRAFLLWKNTSFNKRGNLFFGVAEILRGDKERFAKIISSEMGKPITESRAEIEKCALLCDYYALHAEDFLEKQIVKTDATMSYVSYEPLGVILAVMPWNFPFWQVFRFAVPAIMAGNTALLKHASNVTRCALAIEKFFYDAGFLKNIFQTLVISSEKVPHVIRNKKVMAVTLTGSEHAGKKIGELAGKEIKKVVLELGGSDPFIILEDADLVQATEIAVRSRTVNSGQSCISAKRFIVVEKNLPVFLELFKEKMKNLSLGNPLTEETRVGPLARNDLRDELHAQVEKSIRKGAKLILGGKIPKRKGFFYPPTILADVKRGMPAYEQELFGPVAAVISAKDEKDAVRIANDTEFGLGASIWSRDTEQAEKLAAQIQSGSVFVNGLVKSDPRLPFGGVKKSGFGRELSSHGIKEFVNVKTVWIK